jgi:glyoxylase-like metal-dependent hydrolase (beta-lactamase superfamily II)/ferredoxin
MAERAKSADENVAGEFFVDRTCIDCDTCRQVAPSVFADAGDHSFVRKQPESETERREALRAVLCCPTNSIGCTGSAKDAVADFPLAIEGDGGPGRSPETKANSPEEPYNICFRRNWAVFFCGFNAEESYGGNSYFIRHPGGNWLIDSPRWLPHLVKRFTDLGGMAHVFFTHQDDIADGNRYAEHFGAKRVVHRGDRGSVPKAEIVLDAPRTFVNDLQAIPTPGHTAGHQALLYRDRFLFTGDHVWWNEERKQLSASRQYCWHSWDEQIESMARLLDYRFSWILPGHGRRIFLPADQMRQSIAELVERMRTPAGQIG